MDKDKAKFKPVRKPRFGKAMVITLSIPEDMLERLKAEVKRSGVDRSQYIRDAIRFAWEHAEQPEEA